MTQIKIKKSGGQIISIEVSGHSGYGEEGNDILCAGISSVLWSTVNGLERVLGIPVCYTQREGYVSCEIPDNAGEKADVLLKSLEMYFDEVQAQYKEFIRKMEV